MRAPRTSFAFSVCSLFALVSSAAAGATLVLTDPTFGLIKASALDQPRLYALVSDPTQAGAFVTWLNPTSGQVEPALFSAFVDTGASGFAFSHLHITGEYDQPTLGIGAADFLGAYTEIGIGGTEVGDVSRPLGIWVQNSPPDTNGELPITSFDSFGDFKLWVRRETGAGEYNELLGPDPINLVGMPAIRQRRLLLDVTPMTDLGALVTTLLAPGAPEPVTQATVPLVLRDFIGTTPPPGEVFPSHYANPLVPGVTLVEGALTTTGEWLLDTGAGSSFASFARAKAIGLIPASYATLASFMADYTGPTAQIGGIGASQTVPILNVDEIRVATREGAILVWRDVDLLVADVAGLDGIFGMNLLVPAVTLDAALLGGLGGTADENSSLLELLGPLLALLFDISPGAFTHIVIDTTNAATPVLRLATPYAAGTVWGWLGDTFSAAERSQAQVGALAADPDGDGAPNLLEYALGLDARTATPRAQQPNGTVVVVGAQRHLGLNFSRPSGGRPDLTYSVEISNNLVTWRRDTGEVVADAPVAGPGEGRETLAFRTRDPLPTTGSARVFLRLAIGVNP